MDVRHDLNVVSFPFHTKNSPVHSLTCSLARYCRNKQQRPSDHANVSHTIAVAMSSSRYHTTRVTERDQGCSEMLSKTIRIYMGQKETQGRIQQQFTRTSLQLRTRFTRHNKALIAHRFIHPVCCALQRLERLHDEIESNWCGERSRNKIPHKTWCGRST